MQRAFFRRGSRNSWVSGDYYWDGNDWQWDAAIGLISRGRRPYGSPATGVIAGGAGPGFPATGSERGPSLIGRFADGAVSRDDETVA